MAIGRLRAYLPGHLVAFIWSENRSADYSGQMAPTDWEQKIAKDPRSGPAFGVRYSHASPVLERHRCSGAGLRHIIIGFALPYLNQTLGVALPTHTRVTHKEYQCVIMKSSS